MVTRQQALAILAGSAGGAAAIAIMQRLSAGTEFPLMAIPFATSIVLVMGSPDAEPAQPRALIGGHLLSTLVGLLALNLAGPDLGTAAVAVGLAMATMHVTRTFHPPAGIDPLVVVIGSMPWSFLLAPVAIGALLLAGFAFVWHNAVGRAASGGNAARGRVWPRRWW